MADVNNVSTTNSPDYYRNLYKKYQAQQETIKEQIIKHISMLSSTTNQLEDNIKKLNTMNNDVTINPEILKVFKDITFSAVSNKEVDFDSINNVLNAMSNKVKEGLKIETLIRQELGLEPKQPSNLNVQSSTINTEPSPVTTQLNSTTIIADNSVLDTGSVELNLNEPVANNNGVRIKF